MKVFDTYVSKNSIWNTFTPLDFAKSLPFFTIETGIFFSTYGYQVEREFHDSFLLLYTLEGEGTIETKNSISLLHKNQAIMIDCHDHHKYYTSGKKWDFMWMHIGGCQCKSFFEVLYPNEIFPVFIDQQTDFEQTFRKVIQSNEMQIINGQLMNICLDQSLCIHRLYNDLVSQALKKEQESQKVPFHKDMKTVLTFIEKNFAEQITIDDMLDSVPISKYHFIRLFKRTIGVTPYHYLNAYRINHGKLLLRTTTQSIAEIAEQCGFLDTSNFIYQFKKFTGQKPTEYRKNFT